MIFCILLSEFLYTSCPRNFLKSDEIFLRILSETREGILPQLGDERDYQNHIIRIRNFIKYPQRILIKPIGGIKAQIFYTIFITTISLGRNVFLDRKSIQEEVLNISSQR